MLNVVWSTDTQIIHIITWSQLNSSSRICHMHQIVTKPRKRVQHATVCYHALIVHQVRPDVSHCVRSGSCSLSSLK